MSVKEAGRPIDTDLSERILQETREQLVADGFAGLRIERVAKAVGCGKTAIYRRFKDKTELVAATILATVDAEAPTPDTGDVREDLLIHVQQNQALQSQNETRAIALVLFDPQVFPLVWERWLFKRKDAGKLILSRAIARGQLPAETAADLMLDTLAGLTLYRGTVKGINITAENYLSVIDALLATPPVLATPAVTAKQTEK